MGAVDAQVKERNIFEFILPMYTVICEKWKLATYEGIKTPNRFWRFPADLSKLNKQL